MKFLLGAALLGSLASAHALTLNYTYTDRILLIDGVAGNANAAGFTDVLFVVNSPITQITDINMRLKIEGGDLRDVGAVSFHGDDSDPGVLLFDSINFNVSDSTEFSVWLDDDGLASINDYTLADNGNTFRPVNLLSAFNGLAASEKWYLSFTDIGDSAVQGVFLEWELEITGTTSSVPETIPYVPAVSLLSLVAFDAVRRRRRS